MLRIDKFYHFTAGFILGILGLLYGIAFNCVGWELTTSVMLLPLVGGVLKELYDLIYKTSKFDVWDLLFTIAGGWMLAPAVYLIF